MQFALPRLLALWPLLLASPFAHAQATPASDCAARFAQDNRVKPEAGAYRMSAETQTHKELDGQRSPTPSGSYVYEVVPPSALRIHFDLPSLQTEMVAIDDKNGWHKQSDGDWKPLSGAAWTGIAHTLHHYMAATRVSALECDTETVAGQSLRSYRYDLHTGGDTVLHVSVRFDAKTGLPVRASTTHQLEQFSNHTAIRFNFDRSIQVKRPPGV